MNLAIRYDFRSAMVIRLGGAAASERAHQAAAVAVRLADQLGVGVVTRMDFLLDAGEPWCDTARLSLEGDTLTVRASEVAWLAVREPGLRTIARETARLATEGDGVAAVALGSGYARLERLLDEIANGAAVVGLAAASSERSDLPWARWCAEAKGAIARAVDELDVAILPELRRSGERLAYLLPTAIAWVGWRTLAITETELEFIVRLRNLRAAGLDEAMLVVLGLMGPHIRQQSDTVDVEVLPILLGALLPRLREALSAPAPAPEAERLAAILFGALHINPSEYSIPQARRRRAPFPFDCYETFYRRCDAVLRSELGIDDLARLTAEAARRFPDLLGGRGAPLPLALRWADKRRDAHVDQSGQEIIARFADHCEAKRAPCEAGRHLTIWDFFVGRDPLVREFLHARDHKIPSVQLQFLTSVRDALLAGRL